VAAKAETHTANLQTRLLARLLALQPGDGPLGIGQEGFGGYRIAVLPPGGQPGWVVAQIQPWGGALEDRHGQGRVALSGQTVGHAAHPTVEPKHLRQHQHGTAQPLLGHGPPAAQQGLVVVWARRWWDLNPLGTDGHVTRAGQTIAEAGPYANRAIVTKPGAS
jgi:hypothetical protein